MLEGDEERDGGIAFLSVWLSGCAPSAFTSLDWGDKSFRRVAQDKKRGDDPYENFAFAVVVDADGTVQRGVVKQFSAGARGPAAEATATLISRGADLAIVEFSGFSPKDLSIHTPDIVLRDNRGHQFQLKRCRIWPYDEGDIQFLVSRKQNARWMEFNNRNYQLSLKINFTYGGQRLRAIWPRIYCMYGNPPRSAPR